MLSNTYSSSLQSKELYQSRIWEHGNFNIVRVAGILLFYEIYIAKMDYYGEVDVHQLCGK